MSKWQHSPPMEKGDMGVAYHPGTRTQRLYVLQNLGDGKAAVVILDLARNVLKYIIRPEANAKTLVELNKHLDATLPSEKEKEDAAKQE